MNFSQWFWKYGYILIVPVVLSFFWFSGSDEREDQGHVNPEVFSYFKQIENDCNAEGFDQQSTLCTKIYKHKKECKQVTRKCNSLTYYKFLKSNGFELPKYYQDGYEPVSYWSFRSSSSPA